MASTQSASPVNKNTKETGYDASFYLLDDFCDRADLLRAQFEKHISTAAEQNAGLTPLAYAFCEDAFQFLTASADSLFTRDLLEDLIAKLRTWATTTVGAASVSTPQARVYFHGCWRHLLKDSVSSRWHYIFSLTRDHGRKGGAINLLTETSSPTVRIGRTLSFPFQFNQLLVHETSCAYGVKPGRASVNALEGAIFLDGYLW